MFKLYKAELISNNLESFLINFLVNLFQIINTFKLGSVFIFTNYRKQLYYKHTNVDQGNFNWHS